MKKNLRNICAAGALLMTTGMGMFTSCTNYDDPVDEGQANQGGTYTVAIDATLSGSNDNQTRALGFDGSALKTTWAATDKVSVYFKDQTFVGTLSPTTTGTSSTTLTGTLSFPSSPASLTKLKLYSPDKNIAYDGQDGTLATIAEKTDGAEAEVTISDKTDNTIIVSGTAAFTKQQAIVKFILKDKSGNSINASKLSLFDATGQLVKSKTTSTTNFGDFCITPATPTNELYVALRGMSNSESYSDIYMTATSSTGLYAYGKSSILFEHGKYYNVTVKMEQMDETSETSGTQFWDGGPYWAKYNIGQTSTYGAGFCFQWGQADLNWRSNAQLGGFSDAATVIWGSPWRMPTKEEFELLLANTDVVYYGDATNTYNGHRGMLLKGRGNYSGSSIFLPSANQRHSENLYDGVNQTGQYWSSTSGPRSGYAWYMSFNLGGTNKGVNSTLLYHGYQIRPVHD